MSDDEAQELRETVHQLELQVQELRQFALMVIIHLDATVPQTTKDHWWEKLGSYLEVSP